MAKEQITHLVYDGQPVQPSLYQESLVDTLQKHMDNLEQLLNLHTDNEDDVGVFARIAHELFERAIEKISADYEQFDLNLGRVFLTYYTYDKENVQEHRAGEFAGVVVVRQRSDATWEQVKLQESGLDEDAA